VPRRFSCSVEGRLRRIESIKRRTRPGCANTKLAKVFEAWRPAAISQTAQNIASTACAASRSANSGSQIAPASSPDEDEDDESW